MNFARMFEGIDPADLFEVRVKDKELDKILCHFFCTFNVPFKEVMNESFEKFLKLLGQFKYYHKPPPRQTLAGSILKRVNDDCIEEKMKRTSWRWHPNSILMINTWKNEAAKKEYLIFTLTKSCVARSFVSFKSLSLKDESAETLSIVIQEAIDYVSSFYKSKVYGIITYDDEKIAAAANLAKTTDGQKLMLATCSSSSAKLLISSIAGDDQLRKVKDVVSYFRNPRFELLPFLERVYLTEYSETRLYNLGRICQSILTDLSKLKTICHKSDIKVDKNVRNVRKILSDPEFEAWLRRTIQYLNPICELIKNFQKSHYTVADAVESWVSLQLPGNAYQNEIDELMMRSDQRGTSQVAYLANLLHPKYQGMALNEYQIQIANDFLAECSPKAQEEFQNYLPNIDKHIEISESADDAYGHWMMMKRKFPTLSELASKLYRFRASTAYSEEIFCSCTNVHNLLSHRMSDEKASYLMNIHFSMKPYTYPLDESGFPL